MMEGAGDTKTRVIKWLRENFEIGNPTTILSKETVYNDYTEMCRLHRLRTTSAPVFGKMMRKAFPELKYYRKGPSGHTKHFYKNLQRASRTLSSSCPSSSEFLDHWEEPELEKLLTDLEEKNLSCEILTSRNMWSLSVVTPAFLIYFRQLAESKSSPEILEFGYRYQVFWQHVFQCILVSDMEGIDRAFGEFWPCAEALAAVSRDEGFRKTCCRADQIVSENLAHFVLSMPQCNDPRSSANLRGLAHQMPVLMHRHLRNSNFEGHFVVQRMAAIHRFSEDLARRALCYDSPAML